LIETEMSMPSYHSDWTKIATKTDLSCDYN